MTHSSLPNSQSGDEPSISKTSPLPADLPTDSAFHEETVRITPDHFAVPGYRVLREIGHGGMGIVYEAIQLSVGRQVALKTMNGLQHAAARERFRLEAEAVAQLQHPNIVQLFDYGEADGRPFFSLEYVNGAPLDALLRQKTLSPRDAAALIETLARAIHVAHERGIVHRDLKPANVLMTPEGTPKISDFGLVKRLDSNSSETQAGDILGTPHYMSPEQALGKADQIGPASDVYSLGAILYELLTTSRPFAGDSILETLQQVRTRDPVPVRSRNPKVHIDLETICMKCLRKEPQNRYASALDLADDLARFLNGEPVHARPITRLERLVRTIRRAPVISAMALLLCVTLVGGVLAVQSAVRTFEDEKEKLAETAKEHAREIEAALEADRAVVLQTPLGLKSIAIPGDNPLTTAKVELGKQLFFDKRLSLDNSVSCADCHNPAVGWSDARPVSAGIGGQTGNRNSPSIVNAAHSRFFFWDGRAENFEEQALGPLMNPIEMGMPSPEFLAKKVSDIAGYRRQFEHVFPDGVSALNISRSLAAFQRTIVAGNTPYDRFQAGDMTALSPAAQRGMKLFFNEAHCSACHSGPYFSDQGFHNIGVGTDLSPRDVGREQISNLLGDRGSFKTPTLREIARTAPYMHDGSMATLEEVVDYYVKGGDGNPQQDEEIYPLKLTDQDKRDLVTFLKEGLSTPDYPYIEAPKLPQ